MDNPWKIGFWALLLLIAFFVVKRIFGNKEEDELENDSEAEIVVCLPKSQFSNLVEVRNKLGQLGGAFVPTIDNRIICFQIPYYQLKEFKQLGYQYTKK